MSSLGQVGRGEQVVKELLEDAAFLTALNFPLSILPAGSRFFLKKSLKSFRALKTVQCVHSENARLISSPQHSTKTKFSPG